MLGILSRIALHRRLIDQWQQLSNSPDNYSENLMREVKRLNASGNALGLLRRGVMLALLCMVLPLSTRV